MTAEKKAEVYIPAQLETLMIGGVRQAAVFFRHPGEPGGWMSNWFRSPFTLDGITFSSMEQYIMYRKCRLFGDESRAAAVLRTDEPGEQRAIGRQMESYQEPVWAGIRQAVALRGLLAKFSQNEALKALLLGTGDAMIVECVGIDSVWSCGFGLEDEERTDLSRWRGQNILGFALMEVRSALKNMSGQAST